MCCRRDCRRSATPRRPWHPRKACAATTSPSMPTRRRRFAARSPRRSPSPCRRCRRMRRLRPPRVICSAIPRLRSRARPCCRWLHCPTASMPRLHGSIRRRRAGISKFRLRRRREPRWRSSRFRATAAVTRSKPPSGYGRRGSRSTSSRPVRCMRWSHWSATPPRCGCGRNGRKPRRNCAPVRRNSARRWPGPSLQPGDIVISDGTPPQSQPAPAGHFLDRAL